jgi:phosphoribosyl 1,2-cyclic phosphate phosphodiesterase
MSARLRATILGCGASPGVPHIGNYWGACDPAEPKNRRSRCALLLERFETDERPTRVLIDTGPDIRSQLLAAQVDFVDAVIYTHAHADHLHGIDDLRAFWLKTKQLLDVYADSSTAERMRSGFGYCFATPPGGSYPPILQLNLIEPGAPLTITGAGGALAMVPFVQRHGDIHTLGIRAGGLVYSCDISALHEPALPHLAGVDTWIVDALRYAPHPSHFSVADALQAIARIRPRHAVLTHMHSDLDYATLRRDLPPGVEPAYDGMVLEFELP